MKIVLDFDDTTFNTHQMMGELLKISEKAGFTEEKFWTAFKKCKEKAKDLNVEVLTGFLYEDSTRISPVLKKEEIIKEMDLTLSKLNIFVYPDFFDFIKSFDKKDFILLSLGTTDFQKKKIKSSKIKFFFDEIVVTYANKAENFRVLTEKYDGEKMFFVEDSAVQIDSVKKEFPWVIVFKMERPQGKNIEIKSELADYVVKDLEEVRKIILNIGKPEQ